MRSVYVHGEVAYVILWQAPIHQFIGKLTDQHPNMDHVQMYRDWVGADHVLRNATHFMFCETIPDVDFETLE